MEKKVAKLDLELKKYKDQMSKMKDGPSKVSTPLVTGVGGALYRRPDVIACKFKKLFGTFPAHHTPGNIGPNTPGQYTRQHRANTPGNIGPNTPGNIGPIHQAT